MNLLAELTHSEQYLHIAVIYGGIVKRLWRICVLIIIDL